MSGEADAAFCTALVRDRDFTSYAVSLFVAPDVRRSLVALAAFNAEIAHVRDHISQPLPGEIRLRWWRDLLTGEGSFSGDAGGNPVAAELKRAIERHRLPVETLVRLTDAHVFDVYDDPMPDMAALEAHCRDTSAALYALRTQVLGGDATETAEHAGIADGLVEVMISLQRHAARNQLYLPADLMAVHGLKPEQVWARQDSDALKHVLEHLRAEGSRQLDQAFAQLRSLPPELRRAFLPMALTRRLLTKLETAPPFTLPSLSRLETLWTLWRASRSTDFRS